MMSIKAIACDFGVSVMFSIFEFVILGGFWSNSWRNHTNRQIKNIWRFVKTLGRSRKKIQAEGVIMFPGPEASYLEENT